MSRQSPSRFHGADIQLDDMPPSRHATEPTFTEPIFFVANLVILLIVALQRVIRFDTCDGCVGLPLEFTNKTAGGLLAGLLSRCATIGRRQETIIMCKAFLMLRVEHVHQKLYDTRGGPCQHGVMSGNKQ